MISCSTFLMFSLAHKCVYRCCVRSFFTRPIHFNVSSQNWQMLHNTIWEHKRPHCLLWVAHWHSKGSMVNVKLFSLLSLSSWVNFFLFFFFFFFSTLLTLPQSLGVSLLPLVYCNMWQYFSHIMSSSLSSWFNETNSLTGHTNSSQLLGQLLNMVHTCFLLCCSYQSTWLTHTSHLSPLFVSQTGHWSSQLFHSFILLTSMLI